MAENGKSIKHLEKHYHTLDDSNPLDRHIKAAGYRSVRQFCTSLGISYVQVSNWHRGRAHCPRFTLRDELYNRERGFAQNLLRMMESLGACEWELFPNVFNASFYEDVYRRAAKQKPTICHPSIPLLAKERRMCIEDELRRLPERWQLVLRRYFGMGEDRAWTLQEIGDELGLTRERIRDIVERALKWLRRPSAVRRLSEFVEKRNGYEGEEPDGRRRRRKGE